MSTLYVDIILATQPGALEKEVTGFHQTEDAKSGEFGTRQRKVPYEI